MIYQKFQKFCLIVENQNFCLCQNIFFCSFFFFLMSKLILHYFVDDDPTKHVLRVDPSMTLKQLLDEIKTRRNNQSINKVFFGDSLIDEADMDDEIQDWYESDVVYHFRTNLQQQETKSDSQPEIPKIPIQQPEEEPSDIPATPLPPIPGAQQPIHANIEWPQAEGGTEFTIFTTANWRSMVEGNVVKIDTNMNLQNLKFFIMDPISAMSGIPASQLMLHIYLPGGIRFTTGTIQDYMKKVHPINNYLYVVATYSIAVGTLDNEIGEICNTSGAMSELYSPMNKNSSQSGKELLACILGAVYHQCSKYQKFVLGVAKLTRFPPLIISLSKLYKRQCLTGLNLLEITSGLWSLFKHLAPPAINDNTLLESCARFSAFIVSLDLDDNPIKFVYESEEYNDLKDYIQNTLHSMPPPIFYYDICSTSTTFERLQIPQMTEQQLNDVWKDAGVFKPLMPLSLRSTHTASLVHGPHNSIRLFTIESVSGSYDTSNADIINPKNGKTKHANLEKFAAKVGGQTNDDGTPVEVIDENLVQQITMVLFDQSASMNATLDGEAPRPGQPSRLVAAKQYLTSWANKSFGYRVSSLQGLISFNHVHYVRSALSPLVPNFEQGVMNISANGRTCLWDTIEYAADLLIQKKQGPNGFERKYPSAKLRILVISDGEDVGSSNEPLDIIPTLINNHIIVDCVIVSTEDECKPLCALCHATGGLAFRPSSIAEGISLFEMEAFLSIELREKPTPFTGDITDDVFERLQNELIYDKDARNRILSIAKAKQKLSTPRRAISQLSGTSNDRLIRIAKELRIAYRWPDEEIKVYPVDNYVDQWRVFLKGPIGTPYEGKWWYIFVTFPDTYPDAPPVFRFISVPYHINISNEGRICMNTINQDYLSTTNVMELISNIKALLMLPNFDHPIDIAKLTLYNENKAGFELKVAQSVLAAKDDYNDYLDGVPINDDAPDGFVVPEEVYVPPQNRSPITGNPIDPANAIMASSGILYDRDELKTLLRSSPQPRCVVTGKILTEDPNLL